MILNLDKSILRPWILRDDKSLAKHANNKNIANFLRDGFPYPYTLRDARKWLLDAQHTKNLLLAIEINTEAVGGIGIIYKGDIYRKGAEIGYWLSEDYWNQGIITEAIETLSNHIFNTTKIVRIYAGIFENNNASAKALNKAGFHLEAVHKNAVFKNGVLMDEHLYTKLIEY